MLDSCFLAASYKVTFGTFRIDDRRGNDNATNEEFDWSREGDKRAAVSSRCHNYLKLNFHVVVWQI